MFAIFESIKDISNFWSILGFFLSLPIVGRIDHGRIGIVGILIVVMIVCL